MAKLYRCDNCNFESDSDDAIVPWWAAGRLSERLNAGDIVPYGVCPECGCFVYRYDERLMRNDAAPDLLAACKAVLANETCAGAFRAAMNMDEKFADDCHDYRLDCERDRDLFNQLTAAIAKAEGK